MRSLRIRKFRAEAMTKTNLVKIGNSKGIRLPKGVIEQSPQTDKLELEVGVRDAHLHLLALQVGKCTLQRLFHRPFHAACNFELAGAG